MWYITWLIILNRDYSQPTLNCKISLFVTYQFHFLFHSLTSITTSDDRVIQHDSEMLHWYWMLGLVVPFPGLNCVLNPGFQWELLNPTCFIHYPFSRYFLLVFHPIVKIAKPHFKGQSIAQHEGDYLWSGVIPLGYCVVSQEASGWQYDSNGIISWNISP